MKKEKTIDKIILRMMTAFVVLAVCTGLPTFLVITIMKVWEKGINAWCYNQSEVLTVSLSLLGGGIVAVIPAVYATSRMISKEVILRDVNGHEGWKEWCIAFVRIAIVIIASVALAAILCWKVSIMEPYFFALAASLCIPAWWALEAHQTNKEDAKEDEE